MEIKDSLAPRLPRIEELKQDAQHFRTRAKELLRDSRQLIAASKQLISQWRRERED